MYLWLALRRRGRIPGKMSHHEPLSPRIRCLTPRPTQKVFRDRPGFGSSTVHNPRDSWIIPPLVAKIFATVMQTHHPVNATHYTAPRTTPSFAHRIPVLNPLALHQAIVHIAPEKARGVERSSCPPLCETHQTRPRPPQPRRSKKIPVHGQLPTKANLKSQPAQSSRPSY